MAHKLLEEPVIEKSKKRMNTWKMPSPDGKFGFSIFIGGKEVFLGVAITPVIQEQIVRQRKLQSTSTVKVFRFE